MNIKEKQLGEINKINDNLYEIKLFTTNGSIGMFKNKFFKEYEYDYGSQVFIYLYQIEAMNKEKAKKTLLNLFT